MNDCLNILVAFLVNSGMPGVEPGWMIQNISSDVIFYTWIEQKGKTDYIAVTNNKNYFNSSMKVSGKCLYKNKKYNVLKNTILK